jgi:membrane dipeptidase
VSAPLVVDGLLVSRWSPEVFVAMQGSGLAAANCTCSVWEGFEETLEVLGRFFGWFREYPGLIRHVESVEDIRAAHAAGQTGVIFGFQNTAALEGRLSNLELFHRLGVRIIQLTYNFQNDAGTGCYETFDGGLTEFGRQVVHEMNRLGIVVDLSHVGAATSDDVLREAVAPPVITHAAPLALRDHPRNKPDAVLRRVAERGGIVGITPLSWFLVHDLDSTVDDYIDAIEHAVDVAGEDHVAIGTDITEGHGREFLSWTMRNRGDGPELVELSPDLDRFPMPPGIDRIRDIPALADHLAARRWPTERIEKVLGENWLRLFKEVWRAPAAPH